MNSNLPNDSTLGRHPPVAPQPISRRQAIRRLTLGASTALGFAAIPHALTAAIDPQSPGKSPAKAKAVIQVWLWGGACHLDTFDPKPDAGRDYCGAFTQPIATKVDGIRINELLPLLAQQADKYSLIRSLTHGINAHETAAYRVQTGRNPGGRDVYPGVGSVVAYFRGYGAGYQGLIPPYVVLTQPQGRFSEAGFLGTRYKPFATGGDPAQSRFIVEGIVTPGMSEARQQERRELLRDLDSLKQASPRQPFLRSLEECDGQAYDLILGTGGKVFDLGQESDTVRERYGRNTFGQSCLMARRLVESGVPYVTINYQGWDTHKQHFQSMRRKLPELDKGLASLLQDLSDRGLLGQTIVWCTGEFGRTPRVQWESPWNGGRGHYGKVFSALVAGGGFKGGRVVGASDAHGEEVSERPVDPCDLIQSLYKLLGIDSKATLPHPEGPPVAVIPQETPGANSGGPLREIV
jgi:hypothetical protein